MWWASLVVGGRALTTGPHNIPEISFSQKLNFNWLFLLNAFSPSKLYLYYLVNRIKFHVFSLVFVSNISGQHLHDIPAFRKGGRMW